MISRPLNSVSAPVGGSHVTQKNRNEQRPRYLSFLPKMRTHPFLIRCFPSTRSLAFRFSRSSEERHFTSNFFWFVSPPVQSLQKLGCDNSCPANMTKHTFLHSSPSLQSWSSFPPTPPECPCRIVPHPSADGTAYRHTMPESKEQDCWNKLHDLRRPALPLCLYFPIFIDTRAQFQRTSVDTLESLLDVNPESTHLSLRNRSTRARICDDSEVLFAFFRHQRSPSPPSETVDLQYVKVTALRSRFMRSGSSPK